MREIILGLPSVPWEEQTGIVLRIKEVWGFKYRGGPQNERRAPGCMYHAPKRPCSYGGIIYSFSGICQHIFLKIFPITDSVPIIKFFCFTSLAGYLMTPQDPDKKEESGPVIPDKKLLKTVKKLLYKFEKMEYSSSIFF